MNMSNIDIKNENLQLFILNSSIYWDYDLSKKKRNIGRTNLNKLLKKWQKIGIHIDYLCILLKNNDDYIKLDAASYLINNELCSEDIKNMAIEILKKIISENKSGASSMSSAFFRIKKIDYYDPIIKEYFQYEK